VRVTDFPMLLVEDDPGEIVRVQEALAQANLVNPLRIVNDGLKAIAYLSGQDEYADRESHPFPSLVLLDLTLSEPPGMQVLAWIRSQENLKDLPVIVLTSSTADQGDVDPPAASGVTSYLAKPVQCEPLLEMMRSIGMYWMVLDKTCPQAGQPGAPIQNPQVLVVDRDVDFLKSIGEAMRRRAPPIVVDPVLDPADALRRLARNALNALVYERGIEESEEFGFLEKVRAVNSDIPVFILCAEKDEAFSTRAILRGVTSVLVKQVRLDLFSDQLHGLLVATKTPVLAAPPAAPDPKQPRDSSDDTPYRTPRRGAGSGRRQDTDMLGKQITFKKTSWELVRAAPEPEALDALIRMYWKPLYFFVRQRGFGNEEAKDLVQEFFAGALEHNIIPKADPQRGLFRTFLLASLSNFLKDHRRSGRRLKRGGGRAPVSLDASLGEPKVAAKVKASEPPEKILDRAWAKGVLGQCILDLQGKSSHLKAFDLQMGGMDYVSIGKATGLSATAAKTAVHRLRVRLRGVLRSRLRLENATEEEVERHVADLASLLA
jgi:RNA polymerase sigma factor (sigma-70 family)